MGIQRWHKAPAISKTETVKTGPHHFLPLFDGIESSSTPQEALAVPEESINLLEAESSSIVLTIFAANVDVRLDEKMTVELLRATKKNPPSRLRYELIYVSLIVVDVFSNGFLFIPRRGKTNMTQAPGRKTKRHMIPGACFKGFGPILKGSSHPVD